MATTAVVSEARQLAPHQSKGERISGHLASLSKDLREWTELRVELVKRQVEGVQAQVERVQHYVDAAGFFVTAGALALTAIAFILVALAFWIGSLVGSDALGFLITAGLLILIAVILGVLGLRTVRRSELKAHEARLVQREANRPTPDDLKRQQRASATNAAL
ncbi:MAG: phage holin family protein [Bacteroidota bacterium]